MGPRADFSCRACAKAAGEDGLHVHADLPVESRRCPIRGTKIQRLFNMVNVGSGQARATDQIIERSTIPAQHDAAQAAKAVPKSTQVMKLGAAGALGAVQNYPGAALYSRGGTDAKGERVVAAVDVLRTLTKPRPVPHA